MKRGQGVLGRGKVRREGLAGDGGACTQCGAYLNPVAVMLGPVCGQCCRANQLRVCGKAG